MIINPYKFLSLRHIGNSIENISPILYEQFLNIHTSIKDIVYKNAITMKVQKYTLFEDIAIETINRCNGSCSFCPVNRNIDPRKFHLLEKELFFSIINQLSDINYRGVVTLHCNNEPFLDKRIFEFAEYTRNKLPNVSISLCTNGSLLTPEKFYKIIPNLNHLIIDNYNDKLRLNKDVESIYEICKSNEEYNKKIWIILRKENEILTSRSGKAKNRKNIKLLSSPCIYPFMQLSIRSDGKVNMCCNDALGIETLGDTHKETLIDIWNGLRYKEVRQKILLNRNLLNLCKNCDEIVIPIDIRNII